MTNDDKKTVDDLVSFAREETQDRESDTANEKKLLIVDDEKEIHTMTRLVLEDYQFKGASLCFLSAYSGAEAKTLLEQHPDIACVLLDVVMETTDAGLEVARFIREDLNNDKIRIILRTGQPGKAPEREIILSYDINDYKEKTELTTQKLFTTITTALRSYNHLVELENKTREIVKKNDRLNQEIAKRIVAESKLKKHNKTLEKRIESKSEALKNALDNLNHAQLQIDDFQIRLDISNDISMISSVSADRIESSNTQLQSNLNIINRYRTDLTDLLKKYETLGQILAEHSEKEGERLSATDGALNAIRDIQDRLDLEQLLRHYPEIIQESSNGIESIFDTVSEMKRFLGIKNESKEKTDINRMIKSAVKKAEKSFGNGIDIQMDLAALPHIPAAVCTLEQAFYEILKNSYKALEGKGIISVASMAEADSILINFSDLGHGISQSEQETLFTAGSNLQDCGTAGLGLTYVRHAISDHNGRITVESTKGEGTTVTVELDVSE
ncbi:MAG: response regulator [Desulfobacteraceae bacterium]|nr:MAG: response regulator [Desulfobacteraceae bacterium]